MKIHVPIKVCPECNSHLFKTDDSTKEMYCLLCGLTIHAPYSTDFIRPDLKTIDMTINIPETVEIITKKDIRIMYLKKHKETSRS